MHKLTQHLPTKNSNCFSRVYFLTFSTRDTQQVRLIGVLVELETISWVQKCKNRIGAWETEKHVLRPFMRVVAENEQKMCSPKLFFVFLENDFLWKFIGSGLEVMSLKCDGQ